MFYPYITISAAQAHEIHNLRHACRHFLSLFLLFQALQRILGHVRPWRIVAVHPPKRGKCVGCIWRSLRIGNFVRHCDVIGLQMLLWRMQTLNWGTESIIESGSQKIFSSMKPLGPVLERTCVQITGLSNPSDPAAYQHFYSADPHWRITAAKSNSTKIYSHRFSPFAFHPNIRAQRFTFLIRTWPFQPRLKKLFQFCFTQISVESEPTLRLKTQNNPSCTFVFPDSTLWILSVVHYKSLSHRLEHPATRPELHLPNLLLHVHETSDCNKYPACQLISHWFTSFVSSPSFNFQRPLLWTYTVDVKSSCLHLKCPLFSLHTLSPHRSLFISFSTAMSFIHVLLIVAAVEYKWVMTGHAGHRGARLSESLALSVLQSGRFSFRPCHLSLCWMRRLICKKCKVFSGTCGCLGSFTSWVKTTDSGLKISAPTFSLAL